MGVDVTMGIKLQLNPRNTTGSGLLLHGMKCKHLLVSYGNCQTSMIEDVMEHIQAGPPDKCVLCYDKATPHANMAVLPFG